MKIQQVSISRVRPYDQNARTHDRAQIAALAESIKQFGFNVPVVLSKDFDVIAGHGRLEAAKILKLDKVPCLIAEHLTPEKVRLYRLADNRLSELSGWDREMLAKELKDLEGLNIDVDLGEIGFSDTFLQNMMGDLWHDAGSEEPEDDAEQSYMEEVPNVTRTGDIWLLGRHRLGCGDSCDPEHVRKVLNGNRPNLMVTDPPYGVNYDPSWRDGVPHKDLGVRYGSKPWEVANDGRADWAEAWKLFPGDIAYVWHSGLHCVVVAKSLEDCGFRLRSQICWVKQKAILSRGAYHWQHEPCWYAVRDGAKANWASDRKQTTVWNIRINHGWLKGTGTDDEVVAHATQKPIECMMRPMLHNSVEDDFVYEPFSGSGSTLIAAERSRRICLASELEPRCVDVAVRRWQKRSGLIAVLEATGKTFAEVEAERA